MITLIIVLCMAGANCQELKGDERYPSVAACQRAAEIKLASAADRLAELGLEVKNIRCMADRPATRG